MNATQKTTFFIFFAFVCSVSIFLFIMFILPDTEYQQHEEFYSQNLPGKNIFLFGASQIYALNPTIISNYLEEKGHNYTVYNLGRGSSDAEDWLRESDLVISQNPDVVVFGLSFHTFYSYGRNIVEKPPQSLLAPQKISDLLSTIDIPFNNGLIDNPKLAIIKTINDFFIKRSEAYTEEPKRPWPNTPFFIYTPEYTEIFADPNDLKKDGKLANYKGNEIYPINTNRGYAALKELVHKFNEHDIEVIIYTTPHLKTWLEKLPIQQKEIFNSMVENLSNEFSFEVFTLHDKYDALDIWVDHDHIVSHNNKTNFYSEDVAKIIFTRIKG